VDITSHAICSALLVCPNITDNLGSSGNKTFFCEIQDGGPLKLKKNVKRLNPRAIFVD
jgi:hypothetical protein